MVASAFHGSQFEPALDRARLSRQVHRIRAYMLGCGWQTLREIRQALESLYAPAIFPEASISAQLRNLKRAPFHNRLEKRRRISAAPASHISRASGIWEYRVLPPGPIITDTEPAGSAS